MLDTRHFSEDFKAELLATIDDLDEQCDGLLVHSENFQALNLLRERYKEKIKNIYIDPPYNTDASAIMYKNGYKSSTWASLLWDRLLIAKNFLKPSGVLAAAIDDEQKNELSFLMEESFGNKLLGIFCIRSNPSGRPTKTGYSVSHEYTLYVGKDSNSFVRRLPPTKEQLARFNEFDDLGRFEWRNLRREGSNSDRSARRALYYPIYIRNGHIHVPEMNWNDEKKEWDIVEIPAERDVVVWPINDQGDEKTWRWEAKKVINSLDDLGIRKDRSGKDYVYYKRRPNEDGVVSVSSWFDAKYSSTEHGSAVIKDLFGYMAFSYPKSIYAVSDSVFISGASERDSVVLDFFSGSGTTAHAIINLNRTDNGKRKYVLAEMGDYFDSVLKPRVQKVTYADVWKAGSPVADTEGNFNGVSHCFKYIRLESYEDALGNLALHRSKGQQTLLEAHENSELDAARQSYVMNYMLEVETRGSASLLDTKLFTDPTAYQLNVRSASGDETKAVNVDLLETFNYLLGLEVEHIAAPIWFDAEIAQGEFGRWQAQVKRVNAEDLKGMSDAQSTRLWWFRTVYGVNRAGQKVLVVWRNLPSVIAKDEKGLLKDNAVLDAVLIEKLHIRLTSSQDDEVDVLYVNGDHNIAIPKNRRGELMEEARVQLIEEAFHRLMFANTESGEL